MELITRIYYRYYDAQRLVGNEDIAKYTALLMLSLSTKCLILLFYILLTSVYNVAPMLKGDIIIFGYEFGSKSQAVVSISLISLIFSFILFRKNGFSRIIDQNKDETIEQRKRKAVVTYAIFFISVISIPIVLIIKVLLEPV